MIDYILSVMDGPAVEGATLESLRDLAEAEIREQGAFRVDKVSGLFIADNG